MYIPSTTSAWLLHLTPFLFPCQASSLTPWTFMPLPLGSIKPQGWLGDQLSLMASGLAGSEASFYPIVRDSRWMGGATDYSELNEGLPYWFNGLVPLAYGLNDSSLVAQVSRAADYVLAHQDARGWLGPETVYNSSTLWGRMPLLLGLVQMAEAVGGRDGGDADGLEKKIVGALRRFVGLADELLTDGLSADEQWGRARYADLARVVQWLFENHADGGEDEEELLGTMKKLRAWGLDWAGFYTEEKYPKADLNTLPEDSLPFFAYLHAVNVAQGLKTMGVDSRFVVDEGLIERQSIAVDWTFRYHGSPSGSVLGDERMAGLGPWHGSETCTTVETMQTMTYLYQLLGDQSYADRAELAAYNALPAAMTPNNWAHNYMSLPNEPWASKTPQHDGLFWNTGDDSIVYGIQPNYPCCAVNHPQGWPKLLSAVFAKGTNNAGIAHIVLAPGSIDTTIADGNAVSITCDTAYPFSSELKYSIKADKAFTFWVRVPGWQTAAPTFVLNDKAVENTEVDEHGVVWLDVPAGTSSVTYNLSPEISIEQRANDSVAIHHGALLYAIDIGQTTHMAAPDTDGAPEDGSTVFFNNTQPWNLAIDTSTLEYHGPSPGEEVVIKDLAWDYQAPPNYITVEACEIDWLLFHGIPAQVPAKGSRKCIGERKKVEMRPYGSLRSRMTELPTIDQ